MRCTRLLRGEHGYAAQPEAWSKTYDEWLAQLNAQYHLDMHLIPGYFMQL